MRRRSFIICAALLAVCVAAASARAAMNTLTPAEKAAGWKLLFDGKTLNGWKATGNPKSWAVQDGTIAVLSGGGGYLATLEKFGNFRLQCDFKMDKGTNSGIFFHWADLKDPVQRGIEIQVFDSYGKATPGRHDCGAIYDCLAPRVNAAKPAGEWNHLVLTCRNNMTYVDLNGRRVIVMDFDKWTTPNQNPDGSPNKFNIAYKDMARDGFIGLQDHGRKVWFRNIKIQQL